MARTKTRGPARLMFALVLVSASVVGALAYYVKEAPADKVPAEQHRDGGGFFREAEAAELQQRKPEALVMRPVFNGDELSFTPDRREIPAGTDPKLFVVNEFLAATKVAGADTRLLKVEVQNGLAKLFFNGSLANTGFGSTDEKTFLDGIAASLGQFRGIDKFEMYSDGVLVEELGHADLSEPLPVGFLPLSG